MNAIALRDVTFSYLDSTQPALQHLTLDIADDQIVGVVGRSGAGKSTLCALCAGFVPNFYQGTFSGSAIVDGQDVVAQSVANLVRHVGLVGSNTFSQISGARFTVFEEVAFGLENLGLPREDIIERTEWALELLGIAALRDRSPYELSGGQQQRLVIAATLATRPPVLVLDEPTAQLDPPSIAQLATLLRELAAQGTTVVFAEQRLEWAAELADRIIVLDGGQLIADGAPATVFTDPQLTERNIGWPRPALLALQAQRIGRWPANAPLPITGEALLAGLAPAAPAAPDPVRTNAAPIVVVDNVRFAYPSGVEALRGVSLAIQPGDRIALVGPNGAGKSTLVRHLNGLLKPSTGQVQVAGRTTRAASVAQCARHVGIVFQNIRNQLFARTVRDELRFGPRNLGYPPARVEALVQRSLDVLGLHDVANTHPYDLLLPTRRLVAIAAVLAMDTDVLVLDEPTAGLDNATIGTLQTLIATLAAQGKSVVVVSHDLDFCYEALQRVVLVADGTIGVDSTWNALHDHERALLEQIVTLPIALRAGLPPITPLEAADAPQHS